MIGAPEGRHMSHTYAQNRLHGAFSVSASSLAAVGRYIEDQERHHRKMTFEDEFIGLLEKHGVEFDLKYVFG
jgi:putative transposase